MKKNKFLEFAFSLILPAAFLLLWSAAAEKAASNAILPSIGVVANNFANAFDNFIGLGSIPLNIGYSLVRVAMGYTCGVLVALPLGLLMGYFKPVRTFFENFLVPDFQMLEAMPGIPLRSTGHFSSFPWRFPDGCLFPGWSHGRKLH